MKQQDWTHKDVKLQDIRKVNKLYILSIKEIDQPLKVNENIFNERLKTYFLKDVDYISRDEIMNVKWNFFITKGHYIKIKGNDHIINNMEADTFYVSFLEINGSLANFSNITKEDKEESHGNK